MGILDYGLFRKLRRKLDGGPVIVNAARGGHQVEADIVRAFGAASLDVFETEPLAADSPLWALDNAYLTPHIAAISNIEAGVRYFSQIIRDHEAGKPLPNVVDRRRGY
jgi:glyoxylate/hydroxypyruvate reductase A